MRGLTSFQEQAMRIPAKAGAPRRAITLVEMLVALAVTLIMMWAVVRIFALAGTGVSASRAAIDLAERLRSVRNRLQTDLAGATASMLPPLRPEADQGYFELVEGPAKDYNFAQPTRANSIMGDYDDILALTTRSRGEPFVGIVAGAGRVRQQVAEVVWFLAPSRQVLTQNAAEPIQLFNLYRKQLLVGRVPVTSRQVGRDFFNAHDVSARYDVASAAMAVNSLSDLSRRENRYAHDSRPDQFPHLLVPTNNIPPGQQALAPFDSASGRLGEDVLLTNVVSFDVRVWDPGAPVRTAPDSTAVLPSDPAYNANLPIMSYGAYVDLGYPYNYAAAANVPVPWFNLQSARSMRNDPSKLPVNGAIYDTWSIHYEQNADVGRSPVFDENQNGSFDEGTNGLDDNNDGVVDDPLEQETSAPYPRPLRGVQVKIRVYDDSTRQVREVSVVQDFLPE
jgi:hypothetical protein